MLLVHSTACYNARLFDSQIYHKLVPFWTIKDVYRINYEYDFQMLNAALLVHCTNYSFTEL